jgi:hypothetical protein
MPSKKLVGKKPTRKAPRKRSGSATKAPTRKKISKGPWQRPHFLVAGCTEFAGYAVLTIVPGVQYDMGPAVQLAIQMKTAGRIYDWRPAIPPQGISVILLPGTSDEERLAIADEFIALGYQVIERPG